MRYPNKRLSSAFLLIFLSFSIILTTQAQDTLVLEWEQHWETYGVGGTCNFGTHNFFVGDVDDDGVIELITGGMMYNKPNYAANELEAPLRIWNWNGDSFKLEAYYNWAGVIRSIYAADLDDDGRLEVITGGLIRNSTGTYDSIRIWSWDNENLILKASYEGINARSIFVADVNKDNEPEILTSGTAVIGEMTLARLSILRWEENQLFLEESVEWCAANDASANSVYAYDLNNDGDIEIITGGYDNDLTNSSGQLRIWSWNGEQLLLETNKEWRMMENVYGTTITGDPMGNTLVENTKVGDVDGDGTSEIVTGGFTYDGQKINAQLRIWNWDNSVLTLEKSHEWTTDDITEIKAISLYDVNSDGNLEILTSGGTAVYGGFADVDTTPETAQLRIWAWDGENLLLNQKEDWQIGEGTIAWNLGAGDIDNDGVVEIVTVGCMYVEQLCDPDLRIWFLQSTPDSSESSTYFEFAIVGIATAIVVAVVAYLYAKKRH